MLAWSFNSDTMESRAILMVRSSNGFMPTGDITAYFFNILTAFASQIRSSKFLGFTALTQLVHYLDKYIYHCLGTIRSVEIATGHGNINPTMVVPGVDEITQHSRDTSRDLSVLANIRRHLLFAKDVIAHVKLNSHQRATVSAGTSGTPDKLNESMMDAALVLETQVSSNEAYVNYLLERAKNQIMVVRKTSNSMISLC